MQALIEKTNLDPSEVGDIVVGTVLAPGSQRASECRMAAFYAGFPGIYISLNVYEFLIIGPDLIVYIFWMVNTLQILCPLELSIGNAHLVFRQLLM